MTGKGRHGPPQLTCGARIRTPRHHRTKTGAGSPSQVSRRDRISMSRGAPRTRVHILIRAQDGWPVATGRDFTRSAARSPVGTAGSGPKGGRFSPLNLSGSISLAKPTPAPLGDPVTSISTQIPTRAAEEDNTARDTKTGTAEHQLGSHLGLPHPRAWSVHLARVVSEVLAGRRTSPHLSGWATPAAIRELLEHSPALPSPARVRSVRAVAAGPAQMEVVALLECGTRTRALAIRLHAVTMPARPTARRHAPGPRWLATSMRVL